MRAGADLPGAALITGALMLGVYTIVEPAAEQGWGAATTLGLGATRSRCSRSSSSARRPRERRWCRCGSSARAPSPARTWSRACWSSGMFGVFFLGALYLQRLLGYDALETGLAFLPSTLAMGLLSMRYAEPLISRFGAYRTLIPGAAC